MNEPFSEVKRDQVVQSMLDYWSSAPRPLAQRDPLAWEGGRADRASAQRWMWVLLVISIALTMVWLTLG